MHKFEVPQIVNGKTQTHICILCLDERGCKNWQGCALGTEKKKMTASQAQSHLEKVHREHTLVQRHMRPKITNYANFLTQVNLQYSVLWFTFYDRNLRC